MTRFVVGDDRSQSTLFPERLEDHLADDNPVRAALSRRRQEGHPATLLKIYVYGYLNRVQSSRRLERECQRNIELVQLTGRLMPDFKTIADFRKDNGEAIRRSAASSWCVPGPCPVGLAFFARRPDAKCYA